MEARNNADNLVYGTEKALNDLGDKVPATERGQIEQLIEDLRNAKEGSDIDRINSLMEQLQQASHALTQQMYQQASEADGGATPGAGGPSDGGAADGSEDDVVEGEYRQV